MPTITRKIELHLCTEGLTDEQQKAQRLLLYHINDNLYKAANNVSSKLYLDEHVSSMVRLKHDEYLSLLKELARAEKQKTQDEELIAELRSKVAAAEREMTDQELARVCLSLNKVDSC
jgi:septal ring factor EnvC (AmiA/AmiB activator)